MSTNSKTFELKEEHLKLLSAGYFDFDGSCEYGSVGLDCKRPFGNSDVHRDMAKILGIKKLGKDDNDDYDGEYSDEQCSDMDELYQELATAMNVIFSARSFELGKYKRRDEYANNWKKA